MDLTNQQIKDTYGNVLTIGTTAGSPQTGTLQNGEGLNITSATLTGGTVTTSNPLLDMTQTWNDAGVTFTSLKLNVTDTASATGSLLLDLQVGGSSKFSVAKDGQVNIGGSTGTHIAQRAYVGNPIENSIAIEASSYVGVDADYFAIFDGSSRKGWWKRTEGIVLLSGGYYAFSQSATDAGSAPDAYLYRDAAQTLAQRNSTNAQTFNIYNTYTDGSNYERGFLKWDTNVLKIGTEALGTGTAREVYMVSDSGFRYFRGATETFRADANGVKASTRIAGLAAGNVDLGALTIPFRDIFLRPSSSLTPNANGDLVIESTDNTTLTFKYKGSDGVVRSGTVALS